MGDRARPGRPVDNVPCLRKVDELGNCLDRDGGSYDENKRPRPEGTDGREIGYRVITYNLYFWRGSVARRVPVLGGLDHRQPSDRSRTPGKGRPETQSA